MAASGQCNLREAFCRRRTYVLLLLTELSRWCFRRLSRKGAENLREDIAHYTF